MIRVRTRKIVENCNLAIQAGDGSTRWRCSLLAHFLQREINLFESVMNLRPLPRRDKILMNTLDSVIHPLLI